jgi:hypothetical protein
MKCFSNLFYCTIFFYKPEEQTMRVREPQQIRIIITKGKILIELEKGNRHMCYDDDGDDSTPVFKRNKEIKKLKNDSQLV